MTLHRNDRDHAVSRRTFLTRSAAGLAVAGSSLALSGRAVRAAGSDAGRHLIIVLASGGWDTSYALDPKVGNPNVDSPAGDVSLYENIPVLTDASRPAVGEFFAEWAPYTAVVNGINVRSIAHPECRARIMTGATGTGNPDMGAMAAFELGADLPVPYMILGNDAYTGPLAAIAGRVGQTNQIKALLDPNDAYPAPAGSPYAHDGFVPDGTQDALIRDYVVAQAERMRATRGQRGYNQARVDDFLNSLPRGDVLRTQADGFGQRGSTLSFDDQVDMAVRVLSEGISRTVNLDSRFSWDTHDDNAPQGLQHDRFFAGLSGLAQALAQSPGVLGGSTLLDETTVVVVSEMTRTPRLNGTGGKDHWPVASAMLFGAGVAGGEVYGSTNDLAEAEAVDLGTGQADSEGVSLQPGNFAAGVLQVLGVDPSAYFPNLEPLHALCA